MYLWLLTHHVILLLLTIGVFLLRCCCLLRNRSRIQIPRLYNATYNYHGWVLKLLCLNYFATLFYRWNWGLLLLWLVHHLHISKLGWMLRWVLVISSFHYVLLLLLGRLSYTNVILQLWLHNLIHLRPIINLKTVEGNQLFRTIAEEVATLVKKYDGSLNGVKARIKKYGK